MLGVQHSVLPQERHPRSLQSATLEIVEILKIPTQQKSTAARELLLAVNECVDMAVSGRIEANINSFERIGSLSKQLLKEFSRLNRSGKRFLGDSPYDDEPFEFFPRTIQKLAARAIYIKRARRPAHRPNRSIKNPLVQNLVFELYNLVRKRGGKLTLGMHISAHKPNGSLPAALASLHEALPATVPLKISYQTLRRMRMHAIDQLSFHSTQGGPPSPEQVKGEN